MLYCRCLITVSWFSISPSGNPWPFTLWARVWTEARSVWPLWSDWPPPLECHTDIDTESQRYRHIVTLIQTLNISWISLQRGNLKGWRVKGTKFEFKVSFNYTFVNEVAINTNTNPLKVPNETLLHYNCDCFFKIVEAFILNTLTVLLSKFNGIT